MALSDTARRILTEATQHALRLAAPPDKLPVAACRSVLASLLKQGYVEECAVPDELAASWWYQQDGTQLAVRITEAGLAAIDAATADTGATVETELAAGPAPADAAQKPGSASLVAPATAAVLTMPTGAKPTEQPSTTISTRPSLREAAHRILAAWDEEPGDRPGLPDAIAALRAILVKPAASPCAAGSRKPGEGTKQQQVLAMLRRPEGATVAQIAEATGWQAHTVRGFFAGLKRRHGIAVEAAERVRQVGPGQEGAKGSYTVYRIAEAG
ncbi:DUF3489 domain-containing protein [Belnapia moabensis]|uniref:DUF3489 domain-containing protein n=1 Tax=Belnapia moabensis TaxID=365533 RepID=UPI0006936225|nr:DUF3489 domain-containing protein [Belnapia moabensis]